MGSLSVELLLALDEDDLGACESRSFNVLWAVEVSLDSREDSIESRALCNGFELVELLLPALVEELLAVVADFVLVR